MRLHSDVSESQRLSRRRISSENAIKSAAGCARCKHCGLFVPEDRRSTGFCCAGCEAVHALLDAEGLLRFYELGGSDTGSVGDLPRVPAFDWLPELEARHSNSGVTRLELDVQGIRCAACVWLLQTLWQRLAGAVDLRVSASIGQVTLLYRADSGAGAQFLRKAAQLGYPMAPPTRAAKRDSTLLVRFGICSAVAMNAMILAVSLYFGLDVANDEPSDGALRRLFGWVLLGLGTISVVVGGPVFFKPAIASLRHGVVHMDLPISIGLLLAYAGSLSGQLFHGATYFDTVAIFTALMLGGRYLQQRTLARSRDQVLADDGAEFLRARRLRSDAIELVPVVELGVGDELLLAPGDLVPVRCELLHSAATLSLDWINGESEPREFARGDEVPAGAFHGGRSPVRVRVLASYADSGLASLLSQVQMDRSEATRPRFWHRLYRYYALGVLIAAAVGGAVWAVIEPANAMPVAVSVLVITCPCAIGIATPLAFHLGLAQLRRRGVFVRSADLLDKVRRLRHVVFDKTGTVTFGGLRARSDRAIAADDLPLLATMAASSNHPVSQAVLRSLGKAPFVAAQAVREVLGRGVECTYRGVTWQLGSRAFAGLPVARDARRECVFARAGEVRAVFTLAEDYRFGAEREIEALSARGLAVHLLSGDRSERVRLAADRLGIPPNRAHGDLSPDDKADAIAAIDDSDTMMVGDGLNDAPAFAAAYCAGTPAMDRPVLPARADFCFRSASSGAVESLFDVADHYGRVVRGNIALALSYNAVALTLCFAAAMTPVLCAVLMPISSVALVAHTAWRMRPGGAA